MRNQIDTTDAYIENFLPFRTIKELTALLADAFDGNTATKIKRFEAKRVKDLYYRILTKINEVPNFKRRLEKLQETKGEEIPGFSPVKNKDLSEPGYKLKMPKDGTEEFFEQSGIEL